jgi:putative hydrolase
MGFFVKNLLRGESKSSVKQMVKNTDAYLKLLEKYDIDIVSHLNYGISTDAVEIARACKAYGTFVELNGKRINITDGEIEKMLADGVQFICNSDAHSVNRVADFSVPQAVIDRLGIPHDSLANWEKLPSFRSRKEKTKE